jgi:hypothetical protein
VGGEGGGVSLLEIQVEIKTLGTTNKSMMIFRPSRIREYYYQCVKMMSKTRITATNETVLYKIPSRWFNS